MIDLTTHLHWTLNVGKSIHLIYKPICRKIRTEHIEYIDWH